MHRRIYLFAATLLLGLLLTGPALAAPPAGGASGPAVAPLELVTAWWAGLTDGLGQLFARHRHTVDPDGVSATGASSGTFGFDAGAKNRHTVDPNGVTATGTSTEDPDFDAGTQNRHTVDPDG